MTEDRTAFPGVRGDPQPSDGERSVLAPAGVRVRRRPRIPPGVGRGQGLARVLSGWAFRWYCRLKVRGVEHIPRTGPVILASNHVSMLDVPLLGVVSPRPVVLMAKRELFGDPFRRWFIDWLGGFPVRRDISDVRALEIAVAILEEGYCLGLYPEGTRSKSGVPLPFLKGAAWLALRTGAVIVPCGIRGTESRTGLAKLGRKRVRMSFGEPMVVEPESSVKARRSKAEAITADLAQRVAALTA